MNMYGGLCSTWAHAVQRSETFCPWFSKSQWGRCMMEMELEEIVEKSDPVVWWLALEQKTEIEKERPGSQYIQYIGHQSVPINVRVFMPLLRPEHLMKAHQLRHLSAFSTSENCLKYMALCICWFVIKENFFFDCYIFFIVAGTQVDTNKGAHCDSFTSETVIF